MPSFGPGQWESVIAAVNGVGACVLGYYTAVSIGSAGASLAFAWLWSSLLVVSGVAAIVMGVRPSWRSELPWTLTGSLMATAMIGRGLDILWRVKEFSGRAELAVAIWLVMGVATASTFLVVGAMTEALDDGR